MPAYPTLSTQVIGQTESALGAILDPILSKAGTTFIQWLVLTVTTGSGGAANTDQLAGRISSARKIHGSEVRAAIGELADAGLLTVSAPGTFAESPSASAQVRLTEAGHERFRRIRGSVEAVTARLFADLPADDLETTGRVLSIVTARANAELASA